MLHTLKQKMSEYMNNGAMLGLLLDPNSHQVFVYRPSQPVEKLDNPEKVSGEPVLPGFVLEMAEIW